MRFLVMAIVLAAGGAAAHAQALFQPNGVIPVSTDYAEPAPPDVTLEAPPVAPEPGVCDPYEACAPCCDPCRPCGGEGVFARWLAADPFKLPQPALLQTLGINAGGWLQAGITMSDRDPFDRSNGPVLTNDRHADLMLNELWFYVERPIDTSDGFDLGGRFDMFYGTDFRVAAFHGFGAEDQLNGPDQLYGLSLPQFYLEAGYGDLSVKMGRMVGILGYEMVPPMGNFFYSHNYAICYSQPIIITGLMGKYQLNEQITALCGFHQGFNRFEDNNGQFSVQSGLMWTSPDSRFSVAYAFDVGRNDDALATEQYVHSIVLKAQLTERFLYVIENDLGHLNNAPGQPDAEWYGITNYLLYTINENWSAGIRAEWFRDDDGTRVMGLGNLPVARGWLGAPGYQGNFTELTVGLNWKPKANMIIRPEVRWDWYDGPANPVGPYPLPFDAGNSRDQMTLGADFVLMY